MSGAPASGAAPPAAAKATTTPADKTAEPTKETKPTAALEDDEFEDFPVESMYPARKPPTLHMLP
jgi:26 proteasome complex subunit DSS1